MLVAIGIVVGLHSLGASSGVAMLVLIVLLASGAVLLRLEYLKRYPPDPELSSKPWWQRTWPPR